MARKRSAAEVIAQTRVTDHFAASKAGARSSLSRKAKAAARLDVVAAPTSHSRPAAASKPPGRGRPHVQHAKANAAGPTQPTKPRRVHLQEIEYDGEVFKVGDSAYVVMQPDKFNWDEDEQEICQLCSVPDDDTVLECDRCLLGFHLKCLKPPLLSVPKGSWMCPGCCQGKPVPKKPPVTAREKYLSGNGVLDLARIEAIWQEPSGEHMFVARWYVRPELTCTGRQPHHGARELFLGSEVDVNEVDFLLRPAAVVAPADFGSLGNGGDDVFMCEYEYDTAFRRFRRRSERERTDVDLDWDWDSAQENELSSEDDSDEDFNERSERRRVRRKTSAPAKSRGAKSKKQGGTAQGHEASDEGKRPAMVRNQPKMPLAMARAALTLSARPRELPCRETEKQVIGRFLKDSVAGDAAGGNCLYISGVPGTGKTATCLEVVRGMQREVKAGDTPAFRFVEINGLRLPSPHHAYSRLYEALTGHHVSPGRASELLEAHFSKGRAPKSKEKRMVTVVLLDEMDLMVTRRQTVLYNFFDWPMRSGADLAVIGIANTMDLPERLLPRIASRLGQKRVQFMPYSQEQIKTIIESRLQDIPAFKDPEHGEIRPFQQTAMTYVSRKVASVSGDCRRALELCRRATELAEQEQRRNQEAGVTSPASANGLVRMVHVDKALKEMFNSTHVQLMQSLPRDDKLLLVMLHLETRSSGWAESVLGAVADRATSMMATVPDQAPPQISRLISVAARLGGMKLLITDQGAARWKMRMALNIPADDIIYVIKADKSFSWLHCLL